MHRHDLYLRVPVQRLKLAGIVGLAAFMVLNATAQQGLTIAGGMDMRANQHLDRTRTLKWTFDAFLNFRKVQSERGADRYIFVLQTDSSENFERPRFYQAYAQLKGPLGKWNVRAGRYIVPFGLLSNYDTERLVLRTPEAEFLGVKLDEGILFSGFTKSFNYGVSLTGGADHRNPTFTSRIGREVEEVDEGLSLLFGRLPLDATEESLELFGNRSPSGQLTNKFRLGYDRTAVLGPDIVRFLVVAGVDDSRAVGGGYFELERALDNRWSLNAQAGYFAGRTGRPRFGAGITYSAGNRVLVRLAATHNDQHDSRDRLTLQIYYDFVHQR